MVLFFDFLVSCYLLFFSLYIAWCMCYRDCGLYCGGGSYSSVYVPPPVSVFPIVPMICIPSCFLHVMFCVPVSSFTCTPSLLLTICVSFLHAWMKTFGGCMHMYFIICNYMCILKYVYITYFVIFNIISQERNVKHVIF